MLVANLNVLICCLIVLVISKEARGMAICIIPSAPFNYGCKPVEANGSYPARYATTYASLWGIDIEMFYNTATLSGWVETPGSANLPPESLQYEFICQYDLLWAAMATNMANDSEAAMTLCAMAIGEITLSSARIQMGDKYSVPYMSTGLGVLVMVNQATFNWWSFIKPFSPKLWIVFLLTLAIVSSIVWFVERINAEGYIPMTWESVTEWKNASYLVVLSMFNVAILKVLSGPSQSIIIAFLFYNLIIMSTYTASLAVVLGQVTDSYSLTINTLRGSTIGTYPTYKLRLQKQYALSSVITYDSTDQGNMLAAMADMKAGLISAFIYDTVSLQFNLPQLDNSCEFYVLPTTIEPFSYTVLTHRLFNQTMLDAFNGNIVVTQESDIVENLIAKYVPAAASCNIQSNGVDIQQIAGLYIILAAVVGAAILWTVIKISLHIRAVISDFNYQQSLEGSLEGGPESSSKMSIRHALSTVFTKSSLKGSLSMDVSTKRGLSFAANSSKGANINGGFLLSGSVSGNKVTPFNGSGGGSLSRDLGEDDKEVSYMKNVAVVSSPHSTPSKKVDKQQMISVTSNSQIKGGDLVDIHKQNGAAAYIAAAGVNPYADNAAAAAAAEGTIQFLTTTSEIDNSSSSSEISTQSGSRLDGKGVATSATMTPVLIMEPAKTMDLVDA